MNPPLRAVLPLLCTSFWLCATATAEYVPDVLELDGSGGVGFASQPILTLPDGGTIEFWLSADWNKDPGYDPVVLSNASERGIAYKVMVGRDRQSITVQSGKEVGELAHDFGDGNMHHVAIVDMRDETVVLVDGTPIGSLAMSLSAWPTDRLRVGADYYNANGFVGALAAVRIWDVPLDADIVAEFALKDITSEDTSHPTIDFLVGHSRFSDDDFYITDAVIIDADELAGAQE
ncbi:MAG: LamG-like jellyroll fold domain-containing protein [Gammaproteobacteria bacterium]